MNTVLQITRFLLGAALAALGVLSAIGSFSTDALGKYREIVTLSDSMLPSAIIFITEIALGVLLLLNKTNIAITSSRVLVGTLFIFSGFIKANDPMGFGYKLDEYFEVFAADLHNYGLLVSFFHGLKHISIAIAIFMCALEMLLGITLLFGLYKNLTLWLLLGLVVFFGFLTFYSAYFEKVQTCGCFGDAIPLKPWQSFGKDLILTVMVLVLFYGKSSINPLLNSSMFLNISAMPFLLAAIVFPFYTYNYLPIIDFRPYKIGTNLYKAAHPQLKYFYILKNKSTGELKEFEKYTGSETDWEYSAVRTEPIDKTIKPITGFIIMDTNSVDHTDEILMRKGPQFILVAYNLEKAETSVMGQLNDFATLSINDSVPFFGLTSSDGEKLKAFKAQNPVAFPFFGNPDDVPLKTMIRSNPGLVLLIDGTVTDMWHYHSLPSYNDVKAKYFK